MKNKYELVDKKKENKVLFILKKRQDYSEKHHTHIGISTGLFNSASFMSDMLNESGIKSDVVVVNDNNDIDREVTSYKPTHVVIEALWVVPAKFKILCKLHPTVKWIIRLHSEIPFIAGEGIAMNWIGEYVEYPDLYIGINAPRIMKDISMYLKLKMGWDNNELKNRVIYMPNYYPQEYKTKKYRPGDYINIACFGAIRPLKNHLNQALASIKFAEHLNKKLRFHINIGRFESKGDSVYHNLTELFNHLSNTGHELINHEWTPREAFIELCSTMDLGLQVSFSETFNIVGADLVSQGIPIVGSTEIPWMSTFFCASPTETERIYKKLLLTNSFPQINVCLNQYLLKSYTNETRKIWVNYFK